MATKNKYHIGMAGEFGVCSELYKRGYDASITLGNKKAVGVYTVTSNNRQIRIEVKTSRNAKIVTGFFQKYGNNPLIHPDYWVIVYIDNANVSHYHVLTHDEMGAVQMLRNGMTTWAPVKGGVDNVTLDHIKQYEGQWHKIVV